MDAWANVSHYLAYKGESSIPEELRRDFYALSGLFYIADKHFELFFGHALGVQQRADERLEHDDRGVELNLDTLSAFLQRRFPDRERSGRAAVAEMTDELLQFELRTLDDVEAMLDQVTEGFAEHERKWPPNGTPGARFTDVGVVRISLGEANPKYARFVEQRATGRPPEDD